MERNGILPSAGFPHYLICEERDIYSLIDKNHYKPWEPRNSELFAAELALLPEGKHDRPAVSSGTPPAVFMNNLVSRSGGDLWRLSFPLRDEARGGLMRAAEWAEAAGLKAIRNNRGLALRHMQVR